MLNLHHNTEAKCLLKPGTNATGAGPVVDLQDYTGVAKILVVQNATSDTDGTKSPTATVKIQTATDTAFTAATDVYSSFAASDTAETTFAQEGYVDLQACKRYLRGYVTVATATNPTINVGVVGLFIKEDA